MGIEIANLTNYHHHHLLLLLLLLLLIKGFVCLLMQSSHKCMQFRDPNRTVFKFFFEKFQRWGVFITPQMEGEIVPCHRATVWDPSPSVFLFVTGTMSCPAEANLRCSWSGTSMITPKLQTCDAQSMNSGVVGQCRNCQQISVVFSRLPAPPRHSFNHCP